MNEGLLVQAEGPVGQRNDPPLPRRARERRAVPRGAREGVRGDDCRAMATRALGTQRSLGGMDGIVDDRLGRSLPWPLL